MAPRLSPSPSCFQFCRRRLLLGEPLWVPASVLTGRQPRPAVSFSTTTHLEARNKNTKQRRMMFDWLFRNSRRLEFPSDRPSHGRQQSQDYNDPFAALEMNMEVDEKKGDGDAESSSGTALTSQKISNDLPKEGGTDKEALSNQRQQYVSNDKKFPFPMNKLFTSESVLDDASRELIYSKVIEEGRPIKVVSATYGVDIRRVAAVVRLKAVEKQWIRNGKRLATRYANAVFAMLPLSHIEGAKTPHESVNDVHVHRYTQQQLFLPVSESKRFTREDAARAFHRHLLPADKRIPIPELIRFEKDMLEGKSLTDSMGRLVDDTAAMEHEMANRIKRRADREARRVTKVQSDRFEFRFQNVEVEDVGKTGRSKKGTGWRYGVPLYDRQRGHSREVPDKVGV